MVVLTITHMTAVTVGRHTNKPVFMTNLCFYDQKTCFFKTLFVRQPKVMAAMWVICRTTNNVGCHVTSLKKILYNFFLLKVIPQKT